MSRRMLDRLGWRPLAIVAEARSIGIHASDGSGLEIPADGFIVDRPAMLAEMRSMCEASFVKGSVVGVEETSEGYVLKLFDGREFVCRWLIGADGAHSTVGRDICGCRPERSVAMVNSIAEGEGGSDLSFFVSESYGGFYSWRFPSKAGAVSIGCPVGCDLPAGSVVSSAARTLPFGPVKTPFKGRCLLAGDAAGLANPLCYGGIGAALLSGRKAAEAVLSDDPAGYGRWVRRDPMFDHRFMDAHDVFADWSDEQIRDALVPFGGRFSLARGLYAMLRRPRWAGVYFGVFLALRYGWRYPPIC